MNVICHAALYPGKNSLRRLSQLPSLAMIKVKRSSFRVRQEASMWSFRFEMVSQIMVFCRFSP